MQKARGSAGLEWRAPTRLRAWAVSAWRDSPRSCLPRRRSPPAFPSFPDARNRGGSGSGFQHALGRGILHHAKHGRDRSRSHLPTSSARAFTSRFVQKSPSSLTLTLNPMSWAFSRMAQTVRWRGGNWAGRVHWRTASYRTTPTSPFRLEYGTPCPTPAAPCRS